MKGCLLFCFAVLTGAAVFAQDLTWPELARRLEFWPANCTVKEAINFPGRNRIAAGQTLNVVAVRATEVEVETPGGGGTLTLQPEVTDILATARETWKTLTPEQRGLTYAALLQRKELWTYRVKLRQPVQLKIGEMKRGESFILSGVEGNDLSLVHEKTKSVFNVPPRDTDLLASAREILVNRDAYPGRVAEDLLGKLTHPSTGAAAALDPQSPPRIYVFYHGAAWCIPCRQFSPSLLKFERQMKPKYPDFEIIYISGDKSAAEMAGYAQEAGFAWPAVAADRQPEMQIVNTLLSPVIPQLVVTDPQGNILVNSMPLGPEAALKQLEVVLKKSAATRR